MAQVGLNFGDFRFRTDAESLPGSTSRHTGRTLARLKISPAVRGKETNDKFIEQLVELPVHEVDGEGIQLRRFSVANRSYSYDGNTLSNNTVYTHFIELHEIEDISAQCLVIDGMRVAPYQYSEHLDKDAIIIEAKYRVPLEVDQEVFRKHRENLYFDVVREGVSDETLVMRWGKSIWSEDGDHVKRSIVLVEKSYDNSKSSMFFDPELYSMQDRLVESMHTLAALSKLLTAKGVLQEEEAQALFHVPRQTSRDLKDNLYCVADIDE